MTDDRGASLYNRHRPTRFDEMVGQEHVARALGNALRSGRPARGYLFSGPRGTGKTTTARILARCLNCQSSPGPTPEPCGRCDSCLRTGHDDWLDVVEVDAASSARRIDEMRDWLETVRYAPVASRYRVTIMDEAHQIQDSAASALLKTLEEPPPHLVVILCTTHPWDLLPTIRSRVQHFVLRKPGIPSLTRVLERVARTEAIATSEAALDALARAADGSYRDALGLLDQIAAYSGNRVEIDQVLELLGAVARETLFELVDMLAGGDAAGAFVLLEDVLDGGADPEQLLRGLVTQMRYACLLQQGAGARDEWAFAPEELARLEQQANQLAPGQVVRALDLLAEAQLRIRHGGADPRLQLELVAAKLARPALDAGTAALVGRIEALEQGIPTRPVTHDRTPPRPSAPAADSADPTPAEARRVPVPPPAPSAPAPDTETAPPPTRAGASPEPDDDRPPPPPDDMAPVREDEPEPPRSAPVAEPLHASVTLDVAHVARLWPHAVQEVRVAHPPLVGFMEEAVVEAVDDDVIRIALHSPVGLTMMGRPEHRGSIDAVLTGVLGRRVRTEYVLADAPPASRPAQLEGPLDLDALRQELIATFDATEENAS